MGHRFVDESELLRHVRRLVADPEAVVPLQRWLAKQPTMPRLISVTAAAKILSVSKSYVIRLRHNGRFPEGVPVEDAADVYVRAEVEALRPEIDAYRARRGITKEEAP